MNIRTMDRINQLHNLRFLKGTRKYLRENATDAEKELWKYLKGKGLSGRKFRRQHSIGYYIVDFYCPGEKLIIELDGKIHLRPEVKINDKDRNEWLDELGLKIIRFKNEEIFSDINRVLKVIKANFKKKIVIADLSPGPSPKNRRGVEFCFF